MLLCYKIQPDEFGMSEIRVNVRVSGQTRHESPLNLQSNVVSVITRLKLDRAHDIMATLLIFVSYNARSFEICFFIGVFDNTKLDYGE